MTESEIISNLENGKIILVANTWCFNSTYIGVHFKGYMSCEYGCCETDYDSIVEIIEGIKTFSDYEDLRDIKVLN